MSLPEGFPAMAGALPGLDAASFMEAMKASPSVGIRLNPSKLTSFDEVGYTGMSPVPWAEEGAYLPERPVFTLNPLLHAGGFYVQDPSSMVYASLASLALSLIPVERRESPRVLDMCASPGGKTTAMLGRLPRHTVMVANEFVAQRTGALRENLVKWGSSSTIVCSSDSSAFAEAGPVFDIVAVDAPCSGEGMMRKDEDARRQWSESLVDSCAALQREILANAFSALRPGGVLIYSTCTFNLKENERNLAWLVESLGLEPVLTGLEGIGGILPQLSGDIPALRFMPHSTRGEGLFAAMLRKPMPADESFDALLLSPVGISRSKKEKIGKNKKNKGKGSRSSSIPDFSGWLDSEFVWTFRQEDDRIEALAEECAEALRLIEPHVRVLEAGVEVACMKGKDWIPTVPLVLSSAFKRGVFPEYEVDEAAALSYLRGEAMSIPEAPKGYVVLSYRDVPLGLVKNLGQRANNLWPSKWKIRYV